MDMTAVCLAIGPHDSPTSCRSQFMFLTQPASTVHVQMRQTTLTPSPPPLPQGRLVPGVSLEAVSSSAGVKEVPSLESFFLDMKQAVVFIGVAMEMLDSVLVYEKCIKDVTKFLNRILGLKIHVQNMVGMSNCLSST